MMILSHFLVTLLSTKKSPFIDDMGKAFRQIHAPEDSQPKLIAFSRFSHRKPVIKRSQKSGKIQYFAIGEFFILE
jgi:hypothetical protein